MRTATVKRFICGVAIATAALLASAVQSHAVAGTPPPPVTTSTTGASQDDGTYEVHRANTRRALASQGTSCPWKHVGSVLADPGSVGGGGLADAVDPKTGRMIRLYQDCNGNLYSVLDPSPADVAEFAWEQMQASIRPSKVGMQPVDDIGAIVKVDTWYWLETYNVPITRAGNLLGVAASITARPTTITTTWGDGNTTTCNAPGLSYDSATHPKLYREPDPAPDGGCSYRYTTHSGKQPGQRFTVTTTVTWEASWTSGTVGGTFAPVTRQTVNQLKVDQIQSILTKP
jgi:hypothetical protein